MSSLSIQAIALAVPLAVQCQPRPTVAGHAPAALSDAEVSWRKQIDSWRSQREHELSAPDGWLTLVALDWLKPGINSIGSAPDNEIRVPSAPRHVGVLTVAGKNVQLLAPEGGFPQGLTVDRQPAREGPLSANDSRPTTLTWNNLSMVVLPRGDRFALRVKDANSPHRASFHGLKWYAPDLRYAVEARWIPATPPKTVKIPTVIGTNLNLPSPGIAEFTLEGKKLRLEPVLEDPNDTTLFFILRDETSKTTTYEAGRFLRTAFPDHGLDKPGTLVLDFNQLFNPPCAYTPYATCSLPPGQNRLPVAIEAGEQRYQP